MCYDYTDYYVCHCPPGFTGDYCETGKTFVDADIFSALFNSLKKISCYLQILTNVRLFHARTEELATTILTISLVIVLLAILESTARRVRVSG